MYITLEQYKKLGHPLIVEFFENEGDFEFVCKTASEIVKQITNIPYPTSTENVSNILMLYVSNIINKIAINQIQQVSAELLQNINNVYNYTISELKNLKNYDSNNIYTNLINIKGMVSTIGDSQ